MSCPAGKDVFLLAESQLYLALVLKTNEEEIIDFVDVKNFLLLHGHMILLVIQQ